MEVSTVNEAFLTLERDSFPAVCGYVSVCVASVRLSTGDTYTSDQYNVQSYSSVYSADSFCVNCLVL